MKFVKHHIVILLLFSFFACDTAQISEDEVPLEIRSLSAAEQVGSQTPPQPTAIKISVQYFQGTDPATFRAMFATQLGITGWASCPTDPSIETWIITERTLAEFTAIIDAIGVFIIHPPGSAGSSGTTDEYALNQTGSNTSSPVTTIGTFIRAPEFYFENICQ